MAADDKKLQQMRDNPRADWTMADFKAIAKRHGVEFRQPGTSHVTFRFSGFGNLTVPARRPIKPVYVKQFVDLVEAILDAKKKK